MHGEVAQELVWQRFVYPYCAPCEGNFEGAYRRQSFSEYSKFLIERPLVYLAYAHAAARAVISGTMRGSGKHRQHEDGKSYNDENAHKVSGIDQNARPARPCVDVQQG